MTAQTRLNHNVAVLQSTLTKLFMVDEEDLDRGILVMKPLTLGKGQILAFRQDLRKRPSRCSSGCKD